MHRWALLALAAAPWVHGHTTILAPPFEQFTRKTPYRPPFKETGNVARAAHGTFSVVELVIAVQLSMHEARHGIHQLDPAIFEVEGMSGRQTRMFYNNLLRRLPGAHYIEVGTWKGSTLVSALYNNSASIEAVAIDNWSQFAGSKETVLRHVQRFMPSVELGTPQLRFFEHDFFTFDFAGAGLEGWADVYLYDGDHAPEVQELAIEHLLDRNVLRRPCVVIVDDWVIPDVFRSTVRSMEGVWNRGWRVELAYQMDQLGEFLNSTDSINLAAGQQEVFLFWNGMLVLVLN